MKVKDVTYVLPLFKIIKDTLSIDRFQCFILYLYVTLYRNLN